jgi:hypothetical protein
MTLSLTRDYSLHHVRYNAGMDGLRILSIASDFEGRFCFKSSLLVDVAAV